jgi:hypothetical protein
MQDSGSFQPLELVLELVQRDLVPVSSLTRLIQAMLIHLFRLLSFAP